MKATKLCFLFVIIVLLALSSSCVSMYIHGSTPVQRAASAADLLIDGNISDAYIRAYKAELGKAERSIDAMINKAEKNDIYYADIADNISDWILMYNRITTLQRMYPSGLVGKKQFVIFEVKDYGGLKDKAYVKATDALYNEALRMAKNPDNISRNLNSALNYLKRAKKYSRHLDNEINSLGAEMSYNAAESLAYTNRPDKLLQASEYYMLADSWISNYRESVQKAKITREKAAYLYIQEGNYNLRSQDYASFRRARIVYQKAEKIIPGLAVREIAEVNRRLTISLTIVVPTKNYSEEDRIRRELNQALTSSKSGPEAVDINFIRAWLTPVFNFVDAGNSDLLFIPADNYGKVNETYGPVKISTINISKFINGIEYTGIITEQAQAVTVNVEKDFVLYDMRTWRKKELSYFNNSTNKISKNFIARYYTGAPEAKPDNFDAGFLYQPGQYKKFFPELMQYDHSINLVTNYGSLTPMGKDLLSVIQNIEYIERR